MLKALDDCLLDRVFQPALNLLPGASPVECGRFFLMGAMLAAFASIGLDPAPPAMALWLSAVVTCSYLYFATGRLPTGRGRNPMRAAPMACPTRLFLLAAVLHKAAALAAFPVTAASVAAGAFSASMLLSLYLGACDRPPPATQRRTTLAFAH